MNIPFLTDDIPWLTTEQMIEVDRAMMEDYRIDLVRMMENAGRNLAHLADISVPPDLYAEPALGLSVGPIFAQSDIVRLEGNS